MTLSASPTAARPLRAPWIVQTQQVFLRWVRNALRQPWGVAFSLIQPIVWIVLFGQVFSALGTLPGFGDTGYVEYLVPGVLMMTVLYSGAWAGTGFLDDMKSGALDQLLASPVSRSAIIAGQLAQQLVLMIVQCLLVLGIGALAGARYPGGPAVIAAAVGVAVLVAVAFCGLSCALAFTTRNQFALVGISQLIVLPATFLSTAMMPAALLPDWAANVAAMNPLSWAVDLARPLLSAEPLGNAASWRLLGLVAVAAVITALAISALRSYQRSR